MGSRSVLIVTIGIFLFLPALVAVVTHDSALEKEQVNPRDYAVELSDWQLGRRSPFLRRCFVGPAYRAFVIQPQSSPNRYRHLCMSFRVSFEVPHIAPGWVGSAGR